MLGASPGERGSPHVTSMFMLTAYTETAQASSPRGDLEMPLSDRG